MPPMANMFASNRLKYRGWFALFWPDRLPGRVSPAPLELRCFAEQVGTVQHNQFTTGLSRFGPAGTPSWAS